MTTDQHGQSVLVQRPSQFPLGLTSFGRRVVPPPPLVTTNVFCGPRSLASALAARGSVDEFFWKGAALTAGTEAVADENTAPEKGADVESNTTGE